jgi:dihydropyrimidinase
MADKFDWLIRGGEMVSGDAIRRADVAIKDGRIAAIETTIDPAGAAEVVDADGLLVFPGLFDSHNHAYYDDNIEEYSLSAARGGITSLVCFAGRQAGETGSDAAVDVARDFIDLGERTSHLDFGVQAILSSADEPATTVSALTELGIAGFKVFMAFPGFRMVDDDYILALMEQIAEVDGICMVHCENGRAIVHIERRMLENGETSASAYPRSRPAELETEAVFRALTLADLAGCACYIVHLTAGRSLDVACDFRRHGRAPVYLETCPHYLVFDAEDQVRMSPLAKISPPMRTRADSERLWDGVAAGDIDILASDCSGQRRAKKDAAGDDVFKAPFGIPGVEHLFPVVYDDAVRRGVALTALARVFSERPAEIFGFPSKGRLAVGKDADLVVLDPNLSWRVDGTDQLGNSDYSIYEGRELLGKAVFSLQRGNVVLRDGEVEAEVGAGSFLPRQTAKVPA